jgi:hypothetical protein
MKRSRIVGTAALIVLIAGAPGAALSQTIAVKPEAEAAIQTQGAPALTDVRERLSEVGRRLREAKLASYTSPLPQEDYIEAQREIARGDYREAMNHLNQADQELDGGPNYTAPVYSRR